MKMPFVFSNGSNINLKMAFSAIICRQALHNGETIQIDVHLNGDDLINFIRFLLILQSRWSVPFFIDFIPSHFKFLHYHATVAAEGLCARTPSVLGWTEPRSRDWFHLSLSINSKDMFFSTLKEHLIKFITRIHRDLVLWTVIEMV